MSDITDRARELAEVLFDGLACGIWEGKYVLPSGRPPSDEKKHVAALIASALQRERDEAVKHVRKECFDDFTEAELFKICAAIRGPEPKGARDEKGGKGRDWIDASAEVPPNGERVEVRLPAVRQGGKHSTMWVLFPPAVTHWRRAALASSASAGEGA
jgi:hypothetical protein